MLTYRDRVPSLFTFSSVAAGENYENRIKTRNKIANNSVSPVCWRLRKIFSRLLLFDNSFRVTEKKINKLVEIERKFSEKAAKDLPTV